MAKPELKTLKLVPEVFDRLFAYKNQRSTEEKRRLTYSDIIGELLDVLEEKKEK